MPEGGHLVAGVENSVGSLLKDSKGKGVAFESGVVLDDGGREVTTFTGNLFGIGSFLLNTRGNTRYTAKVTLGDGTLIEAALPEVEDEGLALRVVNTPGKGRFLEIRTNQAGPIIKLVVVHFIW